MVAPALLQDCASSLWLLPWWCFFSGHFTSTQRTRGASSDHFFMFWSSVTNLRGQPTWLKAIRGQINWTQSCNGRFWLMRRDSSIWDIWWVYCPRCPSYSSFHRFVSTGANKPLKFSTHYLKTSWNGWRFTIKFCAVNDGVSGPDWQAVYISLQKRHGWRQ